MSFELISQEVLESVESFLTTGFADIGQYLLNNVAVSIFLCLGLGYLLGKLKIGSFTLGATVGTLIIGLALSLVLSSVGAYKIDGLVKTIFFSLFIFAIGYEVGPSFFASLKSSGVKIILLSVIFAAVAFGVCFVLFKVFKVGPGEAGGIVAGALTQSSVLGTADATMKTMLTGDALSNAEAQMPIAYALTYVFGTAGLLIFMKTVAPAILGVNLKEATKEKIAKTGFKESSGTGNSAVSAVKARAFLLGEGAGCIGQTVADMETAYGNELTVEAISRKDAPVTPEGAAVLEAGDVITVIGTAAAMVRLEGAGATETADAKYLNLQLVRNEIVLTKGFQPDVLTKLDEMGVFVQSFLRDGKPVPGFTDARPGDVLTVTGSKAAVQKVASQLGYKKDVGAATDVSFLSIGIVAGLLLGALCLTVKGIPVTLGSGGGALVAGLLFGYYQNKHAKHGNVPSATRWFLKSVGLNLFIAVVGLTAGGKFLSALTQMGWLVLVLGVAVTLLPHIITMLIGKYLLKLDAVDIIGGLCGAGTCTAALNGVIDEAGSTVFALAYTPGYAVGNVLLTVLGPLIVALLV